MLLVFVQLFVWSMKTGRLLDVLSGHEGPIYGLAFSPTHVSTAIHSYKQPAVFWFISQASKLNRNTSLLLFFGVRQTHSSWGF